MGFHANATDARRLGNCQESAPAITLCCEQLEIVDSLKCLWNLIPAAAVGKITSKISRALGNLSSRKPQLVMFFRVARFDFSASRDARQLSLFDYRCLRSIARVWALFVVQNNDFTVYPAIN